MVRQNRIGMFTTHNEGKLVSRPIAISQVEDSGVIWFFTDIGSDKIDQILAKSSVNFSFSDEVNHEYVSLSGTAYPVKNQEKIDELWNLMVQAWLPEGKESDRLVLVEVIPEEAVIWDGTSSKIVQLYRSAKAIVQGDSYQEVGETKHKRVQMN